MLLCTNSFLRRMILSAFNNTEKVAISLEDKDHEGTWKWINGPGHRTLHREVGSWKNTEPNRGTSENCGAMWDDFCTHDYQCNWNIKALCEKAV